MFYSIGIRRANFSFSTRIDSSRQVDASHLIDPVPSVPYRSILTPSIRFSVSDQSKLFSVHFRCITITKRVSLYYLSISTAFLIFATCAQAITSSPLSPTPNESDTNKFLFYVQQSVAFPGIGFNSVGNAFNKRVTDKCLGHIGKEPQRSKPLLCLHRKNHSLV
jgi:hypothetical protein